VLLVRSSHDVDAKAALQAAACGHMQPRSSRRAPGSISCKAAASRRPMKTVRPRDSRLGNTGVGIRACLSRLCSRGTGETRKPNACPPARTRAAARSRLET